MLVDWWLNQWLGGKRGHWNWESVWGFTFVLPLAAAMSFMLTNRLHCHSLSLGQWVVLGSLAGCTQNRKLHLLVVMFRFLMHFVDENGVEESLFESPDWQAGVQHYSFFSSSCAISWQSRCLQDVISAVLSNKMSCLFPSTTKQFISQVTSTLQSPSLTFPHL